MSDGVLPRLDSTAFLGPGHDYPKSHRNVPTDFKTPQLAVGLWMVPNFGMDRIFWSTTNEVAACELSCISNRVLQQTRAPRHVVEQTGSSLAVTANWTCAQRETTLQSTRRRLRSQATGPLRSNNV